MSTTSIAQSRMANGLLDRYWLPKVALATISIASLTGVYLTMTTHGAPPAWAIVRWLFLAALGTLAGGTMWWSWFVRAPEEANDLAAVVRFTLAQQERFRAIGRLALALVVLTLPHLLWFSIWATEPVDRALWAAGVLSLLTAIGLMGWLLTRPLRPERAFSTREVRTAWGALLVAITLAAALDARITFPGQSLAWFLRPVHVLAFTLWIGGAIWNIFIAVPGAQATLAFPVVVSAAEQLERFRWTVRVILPTLVITGLLQAYPYIGLNFMALLFTLYGQLIMLKLVLVLGLVGIFITCPMWRACSPIKGMCDLQDLETAKAFEPTRRLDNRGKACAGFVKIQKILKSMEPDEVLELLSTDRISWWELPAWLDKHGYRLIKQERQGRWLWQSYRFLIQKGGTE